jgi:hypothetical protein
MYVETAREVKVKDSIKKAVPKAISWKSSSSHHGQRQKNNCKQGN